MILLPEGENKHGKAIQTQHSNKGCKADHLLLQQMPEGQDENGLVFML